jgi:hypothetical protein
VRVYFSGVNQHQWLEAMKGQLVLESFADIRPLTDRYRGTWAGGMLDSGAFTEMTTGRPIDLGAYTGFCQEHGSFYDAIINLDDIRGDVDKSLANLAHLRGAGVDAMPVFHQGEPWSVFEDMCSEFDYVGIGFQRPIQEAERFLDGVWSRSGDTKIHGFAMTSYMDGYPFYSVDSTSWLWEVKALLSLNSQGNPLRYLTPSELVNIVLLKYQRMSKADRWGGPSTNEQVEMFQ